MINTGSMKGFEMAQALLSGKLSERINAMSASIEDIIAEIEASFIMEDADIPEDTILAGIEDLIHRMEELLADAKVASPLYEGVRTTIAGLPNVGKSSLFNAILGCQRAIVHQEEGTTRDVLRERLRLGGIDFLFHDTAGIREITSGPEKIGVEKTFETLENSDLVLYVVDARDGLKPAEKRWLTICERTIVVMNKIDLLHGEVEGVPGWKTIPVSAKFNKGIGDLMKCMQDAFPREHPMIFLERHVYLLRRAHACLKACRDAMCSGLTADVLTIDLKGSLTCLRQITGHSFDEDILKRVFSSFCVGK
jgi:tRNA modification GTPase